MAHSVLHEHALLRAPYESIQMVTRNTQKIVAKEMNDVVTEVKKLSKAATERTKGSNLINATKSIKSIVQKLQGLKRKMEEGQKTAQKYVNRCQTRLQHLGEVCKCARLQSWAETGRRRKDSSESFAWISDPLTALTKDETLTRTVHAMMAGHLLREGCLESASLLTKSSDISDMVDTEVFQSAQKVIDGFRQHDCKPALAWCGANRSRLRRAQSTLEADLRIQQFVEILRKDNVKEALTYGREYLSTPPDSHLKTFLHAMGAVAFLPITDNFPQRYKYLFEEKKWSDLESQFRVVLFKINGLPQRSEFSIRLQIGLEALKTPQCNERLDRKMKSEGDLVENLEGFECPVCSPGMYNLASELQAAHRTQSCLVCRMSGDTMDENNPPLALPNGNVYSRKALEINIKQNNGKIFDPSSGELFEMKDTKPVYVL
mmetsp:Transcript_28569/g.39797  ORF Transcript_28569/g.39797 Transcript_28569/m.39797 type:complete len:432 (+) Transcript_28569:179-1474(+)|eukprot:CAMPEP_0184487402 /NCGR_PEP_ID=MMETSP0113_2-20130426/10014_1 /TAXON_ID=91329 /ORGANISM="Norrisiella sphaerica, Strain BC52" /LENGTH=431 /DNA_ID=CAMNT_0026869705 /DNA_START=179 /DNA_END=1474 /DNA_ORIENTATION=+